MMFGYLAKLVIGVAATLAVVFGSAFFTLNRLQGRLLISAPAVAFLDAKKNDLGQMVLPFEFGELCVGQSVPLTLRFHATKDSILTVDIWVVGKAGQYGERVGNRFPVVAGEEYNIVYQIPTGNLEAGSHFALINVTSRFAEDVYLRQPLLLSKCEDPTADANRQKGYSISGYPHPRSEAQRQ